MSLSIRPFRREVRRRLYVNEPAAAPPSPQEPRVPMAYRMDSWDFVDPQNSSPLFSGRIPSEIRSLIFEFALTESVGPARDRHVQHDFFGRSDHDKLNDEPMLAPPAEDMQEDGAEDDADYDSGSEYSLEHYGNAEAGPAPAVQMPPASSLCPGKDPSSGWDWLRPGYVGQRKLPGAVLLRTCRRIYIETNELPSGAVSKTFYGSNGPYFCPHDPRTYVSQLPPEAARQIRHLVLFSDPQWLELDFFEMITNMYSFLGYDPNATVPTFVTSLHFPPRLSASPSISSRRLWRVSEHLTSLRIVFRRTDWWGWESNTPLAISPFRLSRRTSAHQIMHEEMLHALEQPEPLQRLPSPSRIERWSCWGLIFLQMLSLKTLTIAFETSEDKRDEMEAIVRWAHRDWRFPILQRLSGDNSDPFSNTRLFAHGHASPVDLTPWASDLRVLTAEDNDLQRQLVVRGLNGGLRKLRQNGKPEY
ncbi:hypothetical protein VPNG_09391 [Cytospora leucostoma]|uniref:Uncharacterized protein n=1 Tax=Cytospora leucostoma TaxID=1230097 RepID=A0A423VTQ7_9PEZI|nr:hypothetical protein VPNG_09391 [Cytospora leucostoma]